MHATGDWRREGTTCKHLRAVGRIGRTTGAALLALAALASALLGAGGTGAPAAAAEGSGWTVPRVRFEPLSGHLSVDAVGDYRGAIEVGRSGVGVAVVNDVAVEDYVRGIAEVPTRWPLEAQKAQAIAARTYALWQQRTPSPGAFRAAGADICATQACQVYRGLAGERRDQTGLWARAVEETAGQVLLYQDRLIRAMYGSSNGGRSHAGGAPYLPAVEDPDDLAVSPWARWRSVLPLGHVAAAAGVPGHPVDARTRDGLVVITTQDDDGAQHEHGFGLIPFRSAVNRALPPNPGLPVAVLSYRYSVHTEEGGTVVVTGEGYGHNIGMSQYGAMGKARRGMAAPDILASYYGGLRPVALPPERLPASISVAVALDRPAATISGTGAFRVLADDGVVLAHVAHGRWEVRPVPGGVQVRPPADQAGVPEVAVLGLHPAVPRPGEPLHLLVRTGAPALVAVTGPDGAVVHHGLLGAGDHHFELAGALRRPGTELSVLADAGAGRVRHAAVAVPAEDVQVAAAAAVGAGHEARPAPPVPPPAAFEPTAPAPFGRTAPAAVAAVLLAGAVAGLAIAAGPQAAPALARRLRRPTATLP